MKDIDRIFTVGQLIKFMRQILDGMHYLRANNIIHGDLATRNILVDNSEEKLKVTDFGLSQKKRAISNDDSPFHLTIDGDTKIAIPWNAIETLDPTIKELSSASDVWQVGVTFWEIFTLARLVPFLGGPPQTNYCRGKGKIYQQIFDFLKRGIRLNRPSMMAPKIYDLLLRCWDNSPEARPKFKELDEALASFTTKPELLNVHLHDSYSIEYLKQEVRKVQLDSNNYTLETDFTILPQLNKPDYSISQENIPNSLNLEYRIFRDTRIVLVKKGGIKTSGKSFTSSKIMPPSDGIVNPAFAMPPKSPNYNLAKNQDRFNSMTTHGPDRAHDFEIVYGGNNRFNQPNPMMDISEYGQTETYEPNLKDYDDTTMDASIYLDPESNLTLDHDYPIALQDAYAQPETTRLSRKHQHKASQNSNLTMVTNLGSQMNEQPTNFTPNLSHSDESPRLNPNTSKQSYKKSYRKSKKRNLETIPNQINLEDISEEGRLSVDGLGVESLVVKTTQTVYELPGQTSFQPEPKVSEIDSGYYQGQDSTNL